MSIKLHVTTQPDPVILIFNATVMDQPYGGAGGVKSGNPALSHRDENSRQDRVCVCLHYSIGPQPLTER